VPLVLGALPDEAAAAIRSVATDVGAPVVGANAGVVAGVAVDRGRVTLTLETPQRSYPPIRLALTGRHQAGNALVAVRILEAWSTGVAPLPASAIVSGLADCEWPGRMEWLRVPGRGELLIDAAHNPAGAVALADYLRDAGVAPLPIVMAAMEDKDLGGMVRPLAPVASRFIATTVPQRRARSAEGLAEAIASLAPATAVDMEASPDTAVERALTGARHAVAAGSIFLIGPLRARLLAAGASRE
jgi:dihydrofolate synthase/folylpolyglutamate synthase